MVRVYEEIGDAMRSRLLYGVVVVAALLGKPAWADPGARNAADDKEKRASYEQQKNIVYGDIDGVALLMDVFIPTGVKNGVGIVDVVSGAWYSDRGKIEEHRRAQFFEIFCGRGYTVFAIRPGSRSKFSAPEMVANVRKGVAWVRQHAFLYGVDLNNLGITGASAGAHLACLTVVTTPAEKDGTIDQPFKAVAVFFPPTDFLAWGGYSIDFTRNDEWGRLVQGLAVTGIEHLTRGLEKRELAERVRQISPARLVQGKQPPFLIIHGDTDPMVPLQQSKVFIEALKKAGTAAELIVKPGGGHPWRSIDREIEIMADWLDKQLKPKPATDGAHHD
jgi:acetyl esterase/lipase